MLESLHSLIWIIIFSSFFLYDDWYLLMSIAVGYWTLLDIFPRFVGLEPATADDSIFMLDSSKNRMFITSVKIFSKKITLNEYKVCFERALEKEKKLKKYLIRLFGKFF